MAYIRRTEQVAAMRRDRAIRGYAVMPDNSLAIGEVEVVRDPDIEITKPQYNADRQTIKAAWDAYPQIVMDSDDIADFKTLRSDYLAWRNDDINAWDGMTTGERADHLRQGVRLSMRGIKWMFEYMRNLDLEG